MRDQRNDAGVGYSGKGRLNGMGGGTCRDRTVVKIVTNHKNWSQLWPSKLLYVGPPKL